MLASRPETGGHPCPRSLQPVEMEALDLGRWDMRLRCGHCGTYRDIVVSDDVAKGYDLDLARGLAEIAAAPKREDRERMTTEAGLFIAALSST